MSTLSIIERIEQNDPTLTLVNLNYRGMGDDLAQSLFRALESNSHVLILFLDGNDLGWKSARSFAKTLCRNTTIRQVFLSQNCLGDRGVAYLAEALASNAHLEVLKLANNGISAESNLDLSTNSALHTLDLQGNELGDEGACNLVEQLATNTALEYLDLRNNEIKDTERLDATLCECLQTNRHLKRVCVSDFARRSNRLLPHPCDSLYMLLRLNCIGRHSFGGATIHPAEWTRTLEKAKDVSVLFSVLKSRPDLLACDHNMEH